MFSGKFIGYDQEYQLVKMLKAEQLKDNGNDRLGISILFDIFNKTGIIKEKYVVILASVLPFLID